jgi:hypothetical protein
MWRSWRRCALSIVALAAALAMAAVARAQTTAATPPAQAVAERLAIAEGVIAREEAASERAFDPSFRAKSLERLAALPFDALLQAQAHDTGGLGLNVLGDSQADLVYTPVTPCRIIDTRVAGGALSPGLPRSFKVTGDTTFQGGANCGIPFGPATSAMINFVAVSPVGRGNMQITPFGQAIPLASFINYSNTAGTALANGLAVALCNPSAATCTNDVTLQANVSAVDLVADVQGYFQRVSAGGVGTALLADSAVTAPKIATGAVVKSLNGQTDGVTLAGSGGLNVAAGSGTVTVSPDTAVVQSRVSGTCPAGQAIRAISATGAVTCGFVSPITVVKEAAGSVFAGSNAVSCGTDALHSVSITVPAAGTIQILANTWISWYHTAGTRDQLVLGITTVPGSCDTSNTGNWDEMWVKDIPGAYPTDIGTYDMAYLHRTVTVPGAGTYTYYLGGYMATGYTASTDNFWWTNLTATWTP